MIDKIKQLREGTGVSVAECKKALEEAGGDSEKALEILKERGKEIAMKKAEAETKEGVVHAYIHVNSKIGVLLELTCQTDFVARNADFKALANDLAMHIAASDPADTEDLQSQSFIKDPNKTVKDLIEETIAKLGENIRVNRFTRYQL